jgi:hypothetical protein
MNWFVWDARKRPNATAISGPYSENDAKSLAAELSKSIAEAFGIPCNSANGPFFARSETACRAIVGDGVVDYKVNYA